MQKGDAIIICAGVHKGKYAEVKDILPDGAITATMAEIVVERRQVKTKVIDLQLTDGQYRKDEAMTKRLQQLKTKSQ